MRGRIHRSLGLGWNGKPETSRSLAAVASLIGSGAATSVIERQCRDAISSFRGVPWTSLTAGDLAAEWDGEAAIFGELAKRTGLGRLGGQPAWPSSKRRLQCTV